MKAIYFWGHYLRSSVDWGLHSGWWAGLRLPLPRLLQWILSPLLYAAFLLGLESFLPCLCDHSRGLVGPQSAPCSPSSLALWPTNVSLVLPPQHGFLQALLLFFLSVLWPETHHQASSWNKDKPHLALFHFAQGYGPAHLNAECLETSALCILPSFLFA